MRLLLASLGILAACVSASAQQAPPPANTPMEIALGAKLWREIDTSLQCAAGTIALQQANTAAQARIAELEKKLAAAGEDKK